MKKGLLVVLLFCVGICAAGCGTTAPGKNPSKAGGERTYEVRYLDTDLAEILRRYMILTGSRVEAVRGVNARFRFSSTGEITKREYVRLLEDQLSKHNIALFQIEKHRYVATWKDTSVTRQRPESSRRPAPPTTHKKKPAKEGVSLPIVLTKEEQDSLLPHWADRKRSKGTATSKP